MKNASFFSTAILLISALFTSQTAQAQWVNGTSIYPTVITKNVGIGLSDPSFQLEVKGSIGLRSSSNTFLGSLSDDGLGNLKISSYSSPFIGSIPKHILLNPAPLFGKSGNVGIGTDTPVEARLVVKGDVGHTVAMFGKGRAGISLVRDWSTVGFNAYYSGSAWTAMSGGYGALIGCDPSSGRIEFIQNAYAEANQNVSQTYPLVIAASGNVLVGAPEDYGYKLAVNGNVICTELRVKLQGNWPDYVFADGYQLKSLEEVEAHIQSENHLPGIPAAAEVEKEGIAVGDMQKKMMEKIEELTLYLIDQNKRIKQIEQENISLRARLDQAAATQK